MTDRLVKLAALQLQQVESAQVVKAAGIIQQIKNWFKYRNNPEYRQAVDALRADSVETKEIAEQVQQEILMFQDAIKNGDIDKYNETLNNLKSLTAKLWLAVKQTSNDSQKYYTLQEMEAPGFEEWFKKYLPENYDLDLGTVYNKPLKDTKWYANLQPEDIIIKHDGPFTILLKEIKKRALRDEFASEAEISAALSSTEELKKNLQKAIVDGILVTAKAKVPSKDSKQAVGSTEIEVSSAPFNLPGTDLYVQVNLELNDSRGATLPRTRLSVKRISWVTILGKKTSFANEPLPYQVTQVTEQKFAEILREGYKLAFGSDPTAEILASGWAQGILEMGRPVKLPNNNIGNLKATKNWINSGKPYFVKSTKEFNANGEAFVHENAAWQAFATPQEGAAAYWRLIGNRFQSALKWMAAGDPSSATVALAMNHYFTANIEQYASGVSALYTEFFNKIAPKMANLKSAPAPAPGPKPVLKPWLNKYSEEEKKAILSNTSAQPATSHSNNEVDALINTLFASDGPLTSLVKKSMYSSVLPESSALVVIEGGDFGDRLEFARVASAMLQRFLDTKTIICSNKDKVEIQTLTYGSPLTVSRAIQAVCDSVADGMQMKTGIAINSVVASGFATKLAEVDLELLHRNKRSFDLKVLAGTK